MKSIYIITSVIFLLVGCAPSEAAIQAAVAETQLAATANQGTGSVIFVKPPSGALDKAYEALIDSLPLLPTFAEGVSDFELDRSINLSLNRADKLNKVDEKWCLGILFLQQGKETGEYSEWGRVFLVSHDIEGWTALRVNALDGSGGIMASYENAWTQCLFR